MDPQAALSPADVIQADGDNLTGAESIGGDHQKHRVIAQSHGGFPVDAFQKRFYGVPRESARQLFKSVEPRSIDLAIQSSTHSTICREKPKQPTNGGNLMLQTCAAQALARLRDVGFDVAGMNRAQRNAGCLQVIEKAARGGTVVRDRRWRAPANIIEKSRILVADRC